MKDMVHDGKGNIRFPEGSQSCGVCKTKENIIQFERNLVRKGLPITEIAFICKSCAKKEGLIKDSKPKEGTQNDKKICKKTNSY